jgi:hypothetical protein
MKQITHDIPKVIFLLFCITAAYIQSSQQPNKYPLSTNSIVMLDRLGILPLPAYSLPAATSLSSLSSSSSSTSEAEEINSITNLTQKQQIILAKKSQALKPEKEQAFKAINPIRETTAKRKEKIMGSTKK